MSLPLTAFGTGIAWAATLAACWAGRQRFAGTTLTAPVWWLAGAATAVAVVEILASANLVATMVPTLRFAAAVLTFCPGMALLGARRPQDRAWQWVVAGLWLVVVFPAASGLAAGPANEPAVHAATQWFLLLLWLVGFGNGLLGRFAPTAILLGAAQYLVVGPWLPLPPLGAAAGPHAETSLGAPALGLAALGLALWACGWPSARPAENRFDARWQAFRDQFGLLWGLRVMERFNNAAAHNSWPARLEWTGLRQEVPILSESLWADLEQALEGQLRRFLPAE